MSHIDPAELRNALASYATGIAIVSTKANNGKAAGMTINSFASVSLSPPLILWSIDKESVFFDIFNEVSNFAIHILRQDQKELSNHFAAPDLDSFADISYDIGFADLPLLKSYIACFQCEVEFRYEGGDHIIIVGRVMAMDHRPADPLIFHGSAYKSLA